jgi:hypothetical protein
MSQHAGCACEQAGHRMPGAQMPARTHSHTYTHGHRCNTMKEVPCLQTSVLLNAQPTEDPNAMLMDSSMTSSTGSFTRKSGCNSNDSKYYINGYSSHKPASSVMIIPRSLTSVRYPNCSQPASNVISDMTVSSVWHTQTDARAESIQ